ncbi:LysR family transcriptional regulator [Marinomonas gallaica]|uniref:LysR family transcriptional regulator n=1 Tax=Marinomonas gallaica TaxID=1806667 RepID=UPI003A90EBBE
MQTKKKRALINQITDFDIKLIRLFKTVIECGSYTAAESMLGVTKSAISIQMSDLEKRLDMKLCHRGRGGLTLTEEGEAVLNLSEVLLASIEQFRSDVNQINNELRGDLNIALVNNLVTQPQMRVTHALKDLRNLSDKININITMSTPSDIEKGVIDGRFHVGAVPSNNKVSGLEYHTLYTEQYYLYCSDEHPLFSIAKPDKALVEQSNTVITGHRMTPNVALIHQSLNCCATASDHEGIAFLILTGTYIGFLPEHYAEHWVAKKRMKKLLAKTYKFNSEINLVTKPAALHNQILSQFLEFIQNERA